MLSCFHYIEHCLHDCTHTFSACAALTDSKCTLLKIGIVQVEMNPMKNIHSHTLNAICLPHNSATALYWHFFQRHNDNRTGVIKRTRLLKHWYTSMNFRQVLAKVWKGGKTVALSSKKRKAISHEWAWNFRLHNGSWLPHNMSIQTLVEPELYMLVETSGEQAPKIALSKRFEEIVLKVPCLITSYKNRTNLWKMSPWKRWRKETRKKWISWRENSTQMMKVNLW